MNITALIEVKKITREDFEAKFSKHRIIHIDGKEFLAWCVMCPEPIFFKQTFTFVDEDNHRLESSSSTRKAHATHFFPELES
jgi:hypothetical protein